MTTTNTTHERDETMSKKEATDRLIDLGATHEKKEDNFGDTKSGWWMDTVWLAPYGKPQDALQAIEG